MNEHTVHYLNGIIAYVMAKDWKEAIQAAKALAEERKFSDRIKYIIDEEGTLIKNIDEKAFTFSLGSFTPEKIKQ